MPTVAVDPITKPTATATTTSITSQSTSPSMKRASSIPQPVLGLANPQSPAWQQPTSPVANSPSTTSAAIGSTSGGASKKTSQVIDRLTSENERLRRELKAERALREESMQQQRALKTIVDATEAKLSSLNYQIETSSDALSRKERRIDDLRQHLDQATERFKKAEEQAASTNRKLDEIAGETAKQVAEAQNVAKRAESAYDTLVKEYRSVKGRMDVVEGDFKVCRTRWEEKLRDQEERIEKLEILLEQTRQAEERMVSVNREQSKKIQVFEQETSQFREKYSDMVETVDKMKWVIGLQDARVKRESKFTERLSGEGLNGVHFPDIDGAVKPIDKEKETTKDVSKKKNKS